MNAKENFQAEVKGHSAVLPAGRVCLRQILEADAEAIVQLRSDPMSYRFFRSPHQLTLEEHRQWFCEGYLPNPNRVDWIALLDGRPVGLFGLRRVREMGEQVEVSYLLEPAVRGKGYAGEAVALLLQWAAKEWHSKTAFAEIHQENEPSIRFIRHIGFCFWKEEPPFVFYRREL